MKSNQFLVFSACFIFAAFPLFAEDSAQTFSLNQYIKAFINNSPAVAKEYNNLKKQELVLENDFISFFLPSASFGAGTQILSQNTGGVKINNPFDFSLSADWNLFNSFKDYLKYKQQNNNLKTAQIAFTNKLQDKVLEAINIYYNLKLKESLLAVAQSDLNDKKEMAELTAYLYKNGLRGYSDLLQSENTFKNAQLLFEKQKADYTTALIIFNNQIGRDISAPAKLEHNIDSVSAYTLPEYEEDFKTAMLNRQDITTGILELQNAEIAETLTKKENAPSVKSGLLFNNYSKDLFSRADNHSDYSLAVRLNIPIGFFWIDKANSNKIARLELLNNNLDFESLIREVREKVSSARTAILLDSSALEISSNNLKVAKERLDITRRKYNDGQTSATELARAQEAYLSAQIDETNYKYNYHLDTFQYKRALGLAIYDETELNFNPDSLIKQKIKQNNQFLFSL